MLPHANARHRDAGNGVAERPAGAAAPDLALCESCRGELLDATNRRYRYPFTSCSACGPRHSLAAGAPDAGTRIAPRVAAMCPACQREYHDPLDRRFHAEANACPVCGPQVALWDAAGKRLADRDRAVMAAANAVRAGRIVALKNLGGFQLLVDGTDDGAVRRLRARAHREATALPLMCPDLECVRQHAVLDAAETQWLASPVAPIVLVKPRTDRPSPLAASVAPGSGPLGVMLPYTPLLVLLLRDLRRPIVVADAHAAGEPPCIDEHEAVTRLGEVADMFLVHDRPIGRPVADSVVRLERGRPAVLLRARGFAVDL